MDSESSQSGDAPPPLPGAPPAPDLSALPEGLQTVLFADSKNAHAFLAGAARALGLGRVSLSGAPEELSFFAGGRGLLALPANLADFQPPQGGASTRALDGLRARLPGLLEALEARVAPGARFLALTEVNGAPGGEAGAMGVPGGSFGAESAESADSASPAAAAGPADSTNHASPASRAEPLLLELGPQSMAPLVFAPRDSRGSRAPAGRGGSSDPGKRRPLSLGVIASALLERGYFRNSPGEAPARSPRPADAPAAPAASDPAVEDQEGRGSAPRVLCYATVADGSPYASEAAARRFLRAPAVLEALRTLSPGAAAAGGSPDGEDPRSLPRRVSRAVSAAIRAIVSVSGGFYV